MDYRREIDGLRALAVLPVILFHAGFHVVSGGFAGVDIFFVISGYLITTIILAEKQAGAFTIVNFYERRARRILPALFVVMLTSLPFAWLWLLPADLKSFSQSLVAVSVFGSNILFWLTSNYFATATELKPLLHTWSLAVEEQYYVFFPLLLMLAWRLGRRWLLAILLVLAALSLAAAQWGSVAQPEATFYLLPTRGWELLIGAFVAFYFTSGQVRTFSRPTSELGSLAGLALLAYAIFAFDKQTPFPSLYTLAPTVGAALIILFASPQNTVGKLLGSRALVGVGLISYSAYLWHQPLFAFAKHRSLQEPGAALMGTLALVSLVLAYFSWKYVEAPFRSKQGFSRQQIFTLGAVGSVFFIAVGLAGTLSKGFPSRVPASVMQAGIDIPSIDNGWCFYSVDSNKSLPVGDKGLSCWLGDKASARKGLLFGDSFAGQYEPLWDALGRDAKVAIHAVTTNWCYPTNTDEFTGPRSSVALQQCAVNRRYLQDHLGSYEFVVFSANWGAVLKQNKLQGSVDLIKASAARARLVLVMPSPRQFDVDTMFLYKRSIMFKSAFPLEQVSTRKDELAVAAQRQLEQATQGLSNVQFISRDALFNVDGKPSDLTRDGIPFSLDGGHISTYGAKAAAAAFLQSPAYQALRPQLN